MKFSKYIVAGCVALMGVATSCVGDLDLKPNDPNLVNPSDPNFADNSLAMCYTGIAVSGYNGSGSSFIDIEGLDAGSSAYLRLLFSLNEFSSDELVWIWPDAGVVDIVTNSWSQSNLMISGTYYRLLSHISICNQYLANTAGAADADAIEKRAQARVLRAYSYYNMLDLFGQSSFITEEAATGEKPVQISRAELFNWVENELKDVVDNKLISENPLYGRVGLDGAEALLARLYLNGEVFSGTPRWADCQARCENIINRHKGGGFEGSGLANDYLYLFARDNDAYMPGGSNKAENEILFGIAFDADMTQSYGGPTFIISGTVSNTHYIPRQNYGTTAEWSCIRGRLQLAEKFYGLSSDTRDDLWVKGTLPAGTNPDGTTYNAEDYQDRFQGFTGDWATVGGNAIIKFTGRTRGNGPGGWDWTQNADGTYNCNFPATSFATTDQPIIRLADVYLMYAESYINGNVGNRQKALDYMNLVRRRAGAPNLGYADLNRQGIMDERARELYLESTRRSDLIRNKMFSGPTQIIWQYKGNIDNNEGTRISEHLNLYPIPYAVIAAQPDFKQNPGY